MLKSGNGKTQRMCPWSYCTTKINLIRGVVFDFAERRGANMRVSPSGCQEYAKRRLDGQ